MDSDRALKRMYSRFNRTYFNGELPETTLVWWEPCSDADGRTESPENDPASLVIKLDPSLYSHGRLTKLVLLHEMVHVLMWARGARVEDHGRLFDAEIQRLTEYREYRKLL